MGKTGDLVVNVLADSTQFQTGLQQDVQAARKFSRDVNSAMSSAGGNATGRRIQELGRGLEDFSVGYQLGGLSMGLRGVSNNVAQLASSFSPMLGGIAGIGLAVAGLMPMLFNWLNATKDLTAENEKLKDALKFKLEGFRFDDAIGREVKKAADLRKRLQEVTGGDRARDLVAEAKQRAEDARINRDDIESRIGKLIPGFDRRLLPGFDDAVGRRIGGQPGGLEGEMNRLLKRNPIADDLRKEVRELERSWHQVAMEQRLAADLWKRGPGFIADAERRGAAAKDAEEAKRRAEDAKRIDKQNYDLQRDMASSLSTSLMSSRDRFMDTLQTNEGLFAGGFISSDLKRRADEQAVKDLARETGYSAQSPKLTGALRGSAAEFESKLASARQSSEQMLERQLAEARKTADSTGEFVRIGNDILRAVNQPPLIMEVP